MSNVQDNVTQLLARIRTGDDGAKEELIPLVYDELRGLARAVFSGQPKHHTLQPTALLHEAWIKLSSALSHVDDHRHFLVVASRAMRQVLADHARALKTEKRGRNKKPITLRQHLVSSDEGVDLIQFDETLRRLTELNPRHGRIVELRVLGSLTIPETAHALGVSETTVKYDWAMARAWLREQMAE